MIVYLLIISLLIYLVGRVFPRSWIKENKFPFKSFKFEREGKIYNTLKIKKWKDKYPNASILMNKIFKKIPKKKLDDTPVKKLPLLIKESCIAEATHLTAIFLAFFRLIFKRKKYDLTTCVIYALLNIPPIIIQRYNRPRFKKSLALLSAKSI